MQSKNRRKILIHYLPIYGCISTGIIYGAIGVIAILSFLKLKNGGADESSFLMFLNDFIVGKIVIWIILLGTLSYISWRVYETLTDPYGYGTETKGVARRTGIALSTIADGLIAYSAILALYGARNVQPEDQLEVQRQMVNTMLQNWGKWLVISIGCIICATAIIQFWYGVTRGYKERLDVDHVSLRMKGLIHFFAWVGYLARGIILGIIGFFFIKAGSLDNAQYVVNTDKAFDFIGDHVGHVYFILVAVGTICYGLFMFALGATYDADKD
jgi:hypothetical protein